METVYQSEMANIKYDEPNGILKVRWRAGISEEYYWELMQEFFKLTLQLQVTGWLIDARDSDFYEAESMDSKLEQIKETLSKTSLRKIARLVSSDIAFEAKLKSIHMQGSRQIEFQFFNDKEAALQWLKI